VFAVDDPTIACSGISGHRCDDFRIFFVVSFLNLPVKRRRCLLFDGFTVLVVSLLQSFLGPMAVLLQVFVIKNGY